MHTPRLQQLLHGTFFLNHHEGSTQYQFEGAFKVVVKVFKAKNQHEFSSEALLILTQYKQNLLLTRLNKVSCDLGVIVDSKYMR